jgi:UDP-glucose 4-epimerase
MTNGKRVLVTGGAGFVGATLVRQLAERGHAVRVFDNYTTGDAAHLAGVDAEQVQGDIRDAEALDAALRRIDAVIHLAAGGSVIKSIEDPFANFDVNVLGTFRVLDAARRAGVERTVQASTGGALIGDAYAFSQCYRLRTVSLRFANVYGPWSARKQGAINLFFKAIHDGQPIVIYGDGSSSRDYTHVDDIARALRLALETDVPGGTVLHIASGVETTVAELADICRAAAGAPDHPVVYRPERAGEVGRNFASYDLAKKVLGYAPTISRDVGIASTWRWYAESVFCAAGTAPSR